MTKKYFVLNSEPNSNIVGLHPIIRGVVSKKLADFVGKGIDSFAYHFKEGVFLAASTKKWLEAGSFAMKRFKQDRDFAKDFVDKVEEVSDEIFFSFKEIYPRIKAGQVEEDEAKAWINKFLDLYFDLCAYGTIGAVVEAGTGGVTRELTELFSKKIDSKKKINEYVGLLSFRYFETYNHKAEKSLANIAQEIKDKQVDLKRLPKDIEQKIEQHVDDWGWINYGYTGPEYTVANALKAIEGVLSLDNEPKEQIRKIDQEIKNSLDRQEKALKELDLNQEELHLVKVAANIGYVKSLRSLMMFLCDFNINLLLKPIIKKDNLGLNQVGMMTVQEMKHYLESGEYPEVKLLNKRYKYCLMIDYQEGKTEILYDKEADNWWEENVGQEEVDKDVKEMNGQIACQGKENKIKGTVKIVNVVDDIAKFKQDDILVSISTTPDIVPAMKQAKAIITDVGGLTCHAAIVSRELNIPCIIGVNTASKVLQDGEQIEMDMEEGIIRRLDK